MLGGTGSGSNRVRTTGHCARKASTSVVKMPSRGDVGQRVAGQVQQVREAVQGAGELAAQVRLRVAGLA